MKFLFTSALILALASVSYPQKGNNAGFHYLTSYERFTQTYGRWEVRSKILGHSGLVNAFCLLHDTRADSAWGELDIEITGLYPNRIESVAHIFNNHTYQERPWCYTNHYYPVNYCDDYHTYAFEWAPEYLVWELDGKVFRIIREYEGQSHDSCFSLWEGGGIDRDTVYMPNLPLEYRTRPMRFAFDTWFDSTEEWVAEWAGPFDPAILGSGILHSWFKYYEYSPGSGDNGTDFKLTDWDDFTGDSVDFDSTRWALHYNVKMEDGKAVAYFGKAFLGTIPTDPGDTGASKASVFPDYGTTMAHPVSKLIHRNSNITYSAGVIRYSTEKTCRIRLDLYNLNGQLVRTLVDEWKNAGTHRLKPGVSSIPTGTYMLCLTMPSGRDVRHILSISPQ